MTSCPIRATGSLRPTPSPATLGTLFRIEPPPRGMPGAGVGCGDAGNLVPMALALPGGRFHGIDAAEGAIGRGRALVEALGLQNVTLR